MRRAGDRLLRAISRARPIALHLLVSAGIAGSGCDRGEPIPPGISFKAEVSADSVQLGDVVELRMTAVVPAGSRPAFPGIGVDSIGPWRVLGRPAAARRQQGGWEEVRQDVRFAVYRLGTLGPDTLILGGAVAGGDSLHARYAVDPVRVIEQIRGEGGADPSQARDIQDVVATGPRRWPYFVAGGLLLLAGATAAIRWLRRRRRAAFPAAAAAPGPTPEEEFEQAIARLLASGLLEGGLYREFYYEVSRAVRQYLERVHGLPLLESTSRETESLLEPRLTEERERDALRSWLREGDLVKYARLERLQVEALGYLESSRSLVRILAAGRLP